MVACILIAVWIVVWLRLVLLVVVSWFALTLVLRFRVLVCCFSWICPSGFDGCFRLFDVVVCAFDTWILMDCNNDFISLLGIYCYYFLKFVRY